jgi:hypothetical protein
MEFPDLPASAPEPRERQAPQALGRALATVLCFAIFGPLIGGVIVAFRDAIAVVVEGRDFGDVLYFLFALLSVGVPAAYAMGLVPATIVGLVFAAVDFGRRRSDAWLAVVIGALGGILWPTPWGAPPSTLSSPLERHLFLASIVSTLVCWFASTRGLARREASPA